MTHQCLLVCMEMEPMKIYRYQPGFTIHWHEFNLLSSKMTMGLQKLEHSSRSCNLIKSWLEQLIVKMRDLRMSVILWFTHLKLQSAIQILI